MNDTCLSIQDRVAVILGGTSGLGRALAIGMARHGADVVASGRRMKQVECIAREIQAAGRNTLQLACDVTDRESIDALRDAVLQRWERVDILVNAAGYTFRAPTAAVTAPEWQSIMDTNLAGVLRACQSFHQALARSGRGRIINIASLGSFVAFHEVAAYCASKTAVLSLTRSLACEWAREGISVNAIAPGIFPTELNSHLVTDTPRGEELLTRTPMRRFGKPEELLGAAILLASDAASFLTGQCIAVDGGYLASGVNT